MYYAGCEWTWFYLQVGPGICAGGELAGGSDSEPGLFGHRHGVDLRPHEAGGIPGAGGLGYRSELQQRYLRDFNFLIYTGHPKLYSSSRYLRHRDTHQRAHGSDWIQADSAGE